MAYSPDGTLVWMFQYSPFNGAREPSMGRSGTQYSVNLSRTVYAIDPNGNVLGAYTGGGIKGPWGLAVDGEDKQNVEDAVAFIAELRQAEDLTKLPIGRRVVIVGGGMTAIDAGVQAKLIGAEEVTIVYRRAQSAMPASSG